LAAEQYRMDLAAADMEEARRGTAIVSVSEGYATMSRAMRYVRFVMKGRENIKDMHFHRVKKIYSQTPITHLLGPIKRLLPTKIASRIHIFGTMEELHEYLESFEEQDMTVEKWTNWRLVKYQETLAKLTL